MTLLKDPARSALPREHRPPTRRLVAFLVLIAACWATLLATAPSPTSAPVLRTISPGNNEIVKSPDQVVLTFDKPVPAGLATLRILDPDGNQIVFERPVNPPGHPEQISVPMPSQRFEGVYAVAWTLPSRSLEPIGGTSTFFVHSPVAAQAMPEIQTTHDTTLAIFITVARFAALAALVLLVGAAFFVAVIWPGGAERRSVRRLVVGAWAGLVVATAGVFVSFGPYAAWAPLGGAFDPRLLSGTFESEAGRALLSRLYVLIPATLGLAQLMTAPPPETVRERWWRGAAVLGCATAVAATWSLPSDPTPLALTVDTALLTTIAVAVGGLATLGLCRGTDNSVVSRFSWTAAVCAGLLVAVAGYFAVRHGFPANSYGWMLAGTLTFAVLLVVVCLLARRWLRTRETTRSRNRDLGRLRRPVLAVTGAATLILAATATLVVTQAPHSAHAQEPVSLPRSVREQLPPSRVDFDTGSPAGQGSLDFVLILTNGGQNRAHVDLHMSVLDGHDATKDDMALSAVFSRPDHSAPPVPVPVSRVAAGYSTGSTTIPGRGRWDLALTLRATDGSQQTLTQAIDAS
ncbi:copper resistance protein CopC [Amycolatopsis sp. K13G38]|uniref:Copper resistance protein CopC n=1 Tax=Amycolatopsis acididurans TaxID=2724524 RepID=A0ABX1JFB0_9PSEU|nr:copper resistance CopC family protein [Amycolatopsis acididurans]NKQ57896.1 copper resistance protein CopC [Amycolatopsis acididurans]